jgi:CubicO group peptidase (beta-lactamase class C family)
MRFSLKSVVFTFGFMSCLSAAMSGLALDLKSEIDPLVKPAIDDDKLVGCVVAIMRGNETQILAYGETEKGSDKAPNGKTIYEIGSATKAITGTLLADAVIEGKVKLDDPLQQHVPKSVNVAVIDDKPITLEHLASHTSGFPRLPNNMFPKDLTNPYADYTVKEMYAYLNGYQRTRAPGEYDYSNYGMGLLGQVVAEIQGKTYEELVVDRIAKPLEMKDTRITLNDEQKKRLAPPYNASLSPDKNWDIPTLAGAGAIRSTAEDLLKLLQASIAQEKGPVSKALRLAFKKRHTTKDGLGVGLGWHIARDGMGRWHNGMTGGYSAWMSVVPEAKAGAVVLSNTASEKTTELGEMLTRLACGIKVEPPKKRTEIKLEPDMLKPYAGNFAITPDFVLTVTIEDGKLMVQATGQEKFQVYPESKTDFFYRVVDAQITFVPDKEGNVNELVLHQNGAHVKATREK